MNFNIRDAAMHHVEAIEELEKECFSVPWTRQQIISQLPDMQHIFIVAECEEQVLGYVNMMFVLDEGYISNVAVGSKFRRQGIGDALIEYLIDKSKKLDLSFVSLEVRAGNEPAKALYEKHGFLQTGLRKNYYEKPSEDAIIMTYFIRRGSDNEDTCI